MPPSSSQNVGGLYGRLVTTRPQGASKYRSMRSDLAVFGALNLYEYACPANVLDPQTATSEALVARAEQRVGDYMRNTSERSAAERLCSRAHELFGDEDERRHYDEYLQWCDLKAVFDDLALRMDPTLQSCTSDDVAQEIVQLSGLLGSRSQAEALMESFLANRGVEYLDTRTAAGTAASGTAPASEIDTPEGRAHVREQLSVRNMLPDSALRPATPPPATQPAYARPAEPVPTGQQAYYSAAAQTPVPTPQPAGVGVVRRCVCGNINSADLNYCQVCGRPLAATGALPQVSEPRYHAPQPEKKFPVKAIAIIAVIAVVLAGAATYLVLNGLPDIPAIGGSSKSAEASEDDERNTKRIPSGSVNEVECSSSTVIIPLDDEEEPFSSYRAELTKKTSGVSIDTTLNITGTGGFTIGDFNSPDDKTIEDVPAGTYEVVMTDNDTGTVCKFTAKYEKNGKGAAKTIKVVAN